MGNCRALHAPVRHLDASVVDEPLATCFLPVDGPALVWVGEVPLGRCYWVVATGTVPGRSRGSLGQTINKRRALSVVWDTREFRHPKFWLARFAGRPAKSRRSTGD